MRLTLCDLDTLPYLDGSSTSYFGLYSGYLGRYGTQVLFSADPERWE